MARITEAAASAAAAESGTRAPPLRPDVRAPRPLPDPASEEVKMPRYVWLGAAGRMGARGDWREARMRDIMVTGACEYRAGGEKGAGTTAECFVGFQWTCADVAESQPARRLTGDS